MPKDRREFEAQRAAQKNLRAASVTRLQTMRDDRGAPPRAPRPLHSQIEAPDRLRVELLLLKAAGVAFGINDPDLEAELRLAAAEFAPPIARLPR